MRKRKKSAAKPVEEYSVHISDDSDLPDIPSDITDPKCDSNLKTSTPKKSAWSTATVTTEDKIQNFKSIPKESACSTATVTNEDKIQNFKSIPKESACSTATVTNDDKIQLMESPNSYFEQGQSHLSPEKEIIDQEIKKLFDLMDMKIKRKKMADDAVISYPRKEDRKFITIIYEDHGGMSFTRPFCKDDTLQSIFTYICREVEAEILPPVFHLECVNPLKCLVEGCKHCYELEASHHEFISSLPDVLILKEGNFLMDDTMTNFGNVLM
ncbi:uncharacterized protein LOC133176462 isoform X2 [Saccostrea echinata]|nr:uncharacterized protein LOC133176462 isoform X2 [Saccostrea echinata]